MQAQKQTNKQLLETYKQQDDRAGIYRVSNAELAKQLIGSSADVQAALNRIQFELKLGSHKHLALQQDYKNTHLDAWKFEVLERVRVKDEPTWDLQQELRTACSLWQQEYVNHGAFYALKSQ